MRRLLMAARGGGGFSAPPFVASGPYDPADATSTAVLTQLHCHTTGSDGSYTPAQVVADYLAAGYEALQITDHDVVTTQPAGITTAITGNEHSPGQQHIIAIDSDFTRGATTDAQTIIDGIVADGGQAEIAHPHWSVGMTYAEMAGLTDYLGLEIHNGHVIAGAGQNPVTFPGFAVDRWDALLAGSRRDIWGFSVDDLHTISTYAAFDMGRVKVFVPSNTKANIMASLVSGNFVADVANLGVTPGYPTRTNQAIALTCPGAVRIEAWGSAGLLAATDADSFAYGFEGTEDYVRLVAIGDYTEPFSAALPHHWQSDGGTWAVSGGTLQLTSDGTIRKQVLRRHREGDFEAQIDMKLGSGGTDAAALMFNVLNSDYYYMVRIGESGVTGYNNELAVAYTTVNSFANNSQLDNFSFDPVAGTWYTVKMAYTAATGRIQAKVWERGTSEPAYQVDVTDTTWKHGAFGIRANRTPEFDNLYVKGFQTFYQPIAIDPA